MIIKILMILCVKRYGNNKVIKNHFNEQNILFVIGLFNIMNLNIIKMKKYK